ncbi:MAG: anti-sigma factor [Gemmatimonadota bacterium]
MTTNAMTHDAFNEQLMALLEGDLDDATRLGVERHAQGCAECGALLADLRDVRVQASKLPELAPSRDLWAGIAARIEAPVVPIASATAFPAAQRPAWQHRWVRRSAFAAALVGAVSLGYFGAARTQTFVAALDTTVSGDTLLSVSALPLGADSADPAGAPVPGTVSAQLAVATLSADYDREITRLRRLMDERRNQMDPVTVAVIEKNLIVIDAAISESKKAIARDPASRFLIESLNASLESKVELLRIAAMLPNRT